MLNSDVAQAHEFLLILPEINPYACMHVSVSPPKLARLIYAVDTRLQT